MCFPHLMEIISMQYYKYLNDYHRTWLSIFAKQGRWTVQFFWPELVMKTKVWCTNLKTSNFHDKMFLFLTDQKTHSQSHQKTHECLHGLVTIGKTKDYWSDSRQTQCRDFQRTWKEMEVVARGRETTLYW